MAAKHTFALPEELRVPDVKRTCKFDFDRAMKALSVRLGNRTYVMGDQFTIPDLMLGYLANWAKNTGWELPAGNVADYVSRIHARPAFIKTLERRAASERAA